MTAVDAIALDRVVLLEASAGTGKTWTLAALFAKAVIDKRLQVPQILMITFTEAATQELRERARQWLQQAVELVAGDDAGLQPRDGDSEAVALLRHWLLQARQRDSLPALRQRLQRALREMDQAAISTIHGFCQRLLRDHALQAAQSLQPPAVEPATARRRRQLAAALWRQWAGDAEAVAFLHRRFGSVDGDTGLAKAIGALLEPEPLRPLPPPPLPPEPRAQLQQAWAALQHAFQTHGEAIRGQLLQAIAAKHLKNTEYKPEHVQGVWQWLQLPAAESPETGHGKLAKYLPDAIEAGISVAGRKAGAQIASPLFAAIHDWMQALAHLQDWQVARDLQQLHALREAAIALDRGHKRRRGCLDYNDLILQAYAAVTDPRHGPGLVQAVRRQYALAFVDEFQDTDARQWAIIHGLFGNGGLVLVGDAKQAIYGFRGGDVHTWRTARQQVQAQYVLDRNFRSRPVLLQAVDSLFRHAADADMGQGIVFESVQPGGTRQDDDWLHDGQPAPALEWHCLPEPAGATAWSAPDSMGRAATACAEAVARILQQAAAGRQQLRDNGVLRAVEPQDCAVLVRNNGQAQAMREALAACGVASVASAMGSLFAEPAVHDVLALLLALRHPANADRLRAALGTPLFALDADAIADLADGSAALGLWQQQADSWRLLWQRHGPQALLGQLAAKQALRQMQQRDGERRLGHWLHIGEQLQQAARQQPSLEGQITWLQRAMATADPHDANQQTRLESDAGRVRILTLHKSKGLEFPLVFLPFAGIGRSTKGSEHVLYTDDLGVRVRQWKSGYDDAASPDWPTAVRRQQLEAREEDMRLLYVGLTRASHGLWLCSGPLHAHAASALGRLLGGASPGPQLQQALGDRVAWQQDRTADTPPPRFAPPTLPVPPARQPKRRIAHDWRIHSFSRLHQMGSGSGDVLPEPTPGEEDRLGVVLQPAAPVDASDRRFSGTRFGNALHDALEHADFAAWASVMPDRLPAPLAAPLQQALRANGYGEADERDGLPLLADLVARTLQAPLPEGLRLCDLPAAERIAELEFHFSLDHAPTDRLLALLQQAGWLRHRARLGIGPSLEGLMTGKIDLVYRHGERLYLLDYKSNRLPDYRPGTLEQAMDTAEYGLQALLYAVALHRWQQQRRPGYGLERHFGGARYLFCRGLSVQQPQQGVVCPELPPALILAADALLGPQPEPGR